MSQTITYIFTPCQSKPSTSACLSNLMDEVLHFGLKAPPLELDCDQFIGTHPRAVTLINQLFLLGEEKQDLQVITF